jgi:hypothetical protein
LISIKSIAVLVCAFAAMGCGSDDSEATSGTGGTAGAGGSGGTAGASATVTFSGTVTWANPPDPPNTTTWTDDGYAEDMEICLRGTQNCVQVDASGHYELGGVPASSNVAFIATHPDTDRYVILFATQTSDRSYSPALVKTAKIAPFIAVAGCTSPPKAGMGTLYVVSPPGSTVTPTPSATVVYTKEDGTFDPSLTSLPASMSDDNTGAIACDVAPGKYQIDIGQTTGTCHMIEGWPSTGHDIEADVEADSVTVVNWRCQ